MARILDDKKLIKAKVVLNTVGCVKAAFEMVLHGSGWGKPCKNNVKTNTATKYGYHKELNG